MTLRTSGILAAAWLLTALMPRATAATRHLVWHGALLATLATPLLVPLVPRIAVPLIPASSRSATVPPEPAGSDLPQAIDAHPPATSPVQPERGEASDDVGRTLVVAATAGALVCALWFAMGWLAAMRLARRARPAPCEWQLEVNTLAARLRIAREVRLGIVGGRSSPVATGVWRAAILLPECAERWTADRRRAVLIHELAHIRRHDLRAELVAQAACAVYWFNPLVWVAAARLRSERERACDDEVLRLGAQPSSYATHLLDLARELRPALRPSAALAMARPGELEGRLLSILSATRARTPRAASRWAVSLLLAGVSAVAAGGSPVAAPQEERPSAAVPAPFDIAGDLQVDAERAAARRERSGARDTLERSRDPRDRESAVLTLALTSGRDVIPALLRALEDDDPQVREKAAIGLALRRDGRVIGPLITAMRDPDAHVREKAAIALGTTGDARAADALRRALGDPDPHVREKAAAALILHGLTR